MPPYPVRLRLMLIRSLTALHREEDTKSGHNRHINSVEDNFIVRRVSHKVEIPYEEKSLIKSIGQAFEVG